MLCNCGGILFVIRVHEPPDHLPIHKKLTFNRLCDVECGKCGKILYFQPYDFGKTINKVQGTD